MKPWTNRLTSHDLPGIPAVLAGALASAAFVLAAAPASARPVAEPTTAIGLEGTSSIPALRGVLDLPLEQHRRGSGSGGGGGQAVPRGASGGSGGGSGVSSGGGGTRSGGGSRGGDSSGAPGGGSPRTRSGSSGSSGDSGETPTYSRPRDGRTATGTAVARREGASGGGGRTIIVDGGGYYGGLYPWGWGGLGLGGYYGYYDPWGWYDPYPPVVPYDYDDNGALKLKVKPRDAEVYVDGYFAGEVDDFDGVFQRLRLEAGPHRIELRLQGFEPLTFEIRIQPDRTVTYKGELKKVETAN
jgi:hypothetical protein